MSASSVFVSPLLALFTIPMFYRVRRLNSQIAGFGSQRSTSLVG